VRKLFKNELGHVFFSSLLISEFLFHYLFFFLYFGYLTVSIILQTLSCNRLINILSIHQAIRKFTFSTCFFNWYHTRSQNFKLIWLVRKLLSKFRHNKTPSSIIHDVCSLETMPQECFINWCIDTLSNICCESWILVISNMGCCHSILHIVGADLGSHSSVKILDRFKTTFDLQFILCLISCLEISALITVSCWK